MDKINAEKIDLGIDDDKIIPTKPDFHWLWKMVVILIWFIFISYISFFVFAKLVVWKISLETEKEIFWWLYIDKDIESFDKSILKNEFKNSSNYDIYIKNSDEINAYATLGWNILLTKWLLNDLEYEEEIIFIIWHEMEHIKNRDVLQWALTNIPFSITLIFLWIDLDMDISKIWNFAMNYISKNVELIADEWGIKLLKDMNLEVWCAINFFEKENSWILMNYLEFNSDHPTTIKRINNLKDKMNNKNFNYSKCTKLNYFETYTE